MSIKMKHLGIFQFLILSFILLAYYHNNQVTKDIPRTFKLPKSRLLASQTSKNTNKTIEKNNIFQTLIHSTSYEVQTYNPSTFKLNSIIYPIYSKNINKLFNLGNIFILFIGDSNERDLVTNICNDFNKYNNNIFTLKSYFIHQNKSASRCCYLNNFKMCNIFTHGLLTSSKHFQKNYSMTIMEDGMKIEPTKNEILKMYEKLNYEMLWYKCSNKDVNCLIMFESNLWDVVLSRDKIKKPFDARFLFDFWPNMIEWEFEYIKNVFKYYDKIIWRDSPLPRVWGTNQVNAVDKLNKIGKIVFGKDKYLNDDKFDILEWSEYLPLTAEENHHWDQDRNELLLALLLEYLNL